MVTMATLKGLACVYGTNIDGNIVIQPQVNTQEAVILKAINAISIMHLKADYMRAPKALKNITTHVASCCQLCNVYIIYFNDPSIVCNCIIHFMGSQGLFLLDSLSLGEEHPGQVASSLQGPH